MIIDPQSLQSWRKYAPWPEELQVEQDLIISRALVAIYSHPLLKAELAFRGGTALQKCIFDAPIRYSEDIDLVQVKKGPIGSISNALHNVLNQWLGKPSVTRWSERITFKYRFGSTGQNKPMRLKIEINTKEHDNFLGLIEKPFSIDTNWFSGNATITTYQIDELLSTKLRALYQRKKGRDLFDLARAIAILPINIDKIIDCFNKYMEISSTKVSRAEFEKNLMLKKDKIVFREDIMTLLPTDTRHNFDADFELVMNKVIAKLPGEPWKTTKKIDRFL